MRPLLVLLASLFACAPRLEPQPFDAGLVADAGPGDAGQFTTLLSGDGATRLVVDATSEARWVRFDFDLPAEVDDVAPGWDLAFRRFAIMTNGGSSGDGGVAVARVDAGALSEVMVVPEGPWLVDEEDGDDEGATPDYAFVQGEPWYVYDARYHTLTPHAVVYVVRTTAGRALRVRLVGYYDSFGTSGVLSLDWSWL